MGFDMFFGILIFEPKWGFSMGYSLCMHDGRFSKSSHFSIIWCFWSGFLHRTTVNDLWNGFWHVFGILIFEPKWGFCMGYSLCMHDGQFSKSSHFSIIWCFWSGFLHRTTVNDLWNGFWHVFWNFNFWAKVGILHGL